MAKPPMTRRLFVALAISAFVAVSTGTAIGAMGGSETEGAKAYVPAARMGDRGTYSITLDGEWLYQDKQRGVAFEFLTLAWNGTEDVRDADGRLHPTEVVRFSGTSYNPFNMEFNGKAFQQGPAWLPDNGTAWFEPTQNRLVALGVRGETTEQNRPVPLLPVLQDRSASDVSFFSFPEGTLCLAAEPVQGMTLVEGQTVPLSGCQLPFLDYFRSPGDFKVLGWEDVKGVRALRLQQGATKLWFAPGIPFPVRMEATTEHHLSHEGETGRGSFRLDLSGYDAGSSPRTPRGALGPLPPALELAPHLPWGMDDAGVAHPFPPARAFAKAKELDAGFAALLQKSPDAYLSFLWDLGSFSTGAEEVRRWWLELTDGEKSVTIIVAQYQPAPGALLGLPKPPNPDGLLARYEVENVNAGESWAPKPEALPEEWPTVAAVVARWRLYADDSSPSVAWGHRVHCANSECDEVQLDLQAGRSDFGYQVASVRPDPSDPVRLLPSQFTWSVLAVDEEGKATYFADSRFTGGATVAAAASEPGAQRIGTTPLSARFSLLLPTPQAAGVGALALLAGLLYWLWPLAKGVPAVGLFSRLRTSRLLENPQRSRLADIVAAEPGIHFKDLARRSGLANGTLVHHLQKLVDGGQLSVHRSGRYTCYFPQAPSASARASAGIMKSAGAKAVLAAIQAHPGTTMQEVASQCGLQPSTVTYHVQRLNEAGLVNVNRDGRFQRLQAAA